jgi:endo-1,4-beta-xylanase
MDSPRHSRHPLGTILGTVAAVLLAVAAAIVPGVAHAATQICNNQTGTNGGYFYSMWSNGSGSACINLNGGSYTTSYSNIGDFVAGVGWSTGSSATVTFTGSLNANGGTTLLSLYGWTTNPLVEYYIEENYVGSPNTSGTYLGQMTSDGGTYNLYEHQQVNQPCITGNNCTFEQYLAIRTSTTTSGTITVSNFINAWKSHGLTWGSPNYEIMATEAWGNASGSSTVTVNQSGGSGGNTVTVTNPGSQSGTVGTPVSKQISATDSGGASLTYSATGLPPGLSISSSGTITGTPTTAGSYNVTVTARDSTGASGNAAFTWTISSSGGGGSGACSATYTTNSTWPGGFSANVSIKNTSTATISTWTVAFTYPGDEKLTNDYNGTYTQSGASVTLTPAGYNGTITPGATTTVGIQGTWSSNSAPPTTLTCT